MKKVRPIAYVIAAVLMAVWCSRVSAINSSGNEYVIGADDVIEVLVLNHDDLNKTVTVRPDGMVTLARIGDIAAAGKTGRALAVEIQNLYSRWYNRAKVTVTVKDVRSHRVRIVGAVKTAGTYELKSNWRLMDLVAVAGGLSTKPVRVTGRVIRAGKVLPLNVEQAMTRPESNSNLKLEADDLVVLDEQDIVKQVTIIGAVRNPGAYDLDEKLSPVSLVAQAGGFLTGAALSKTYILRGTDRLPLNLQSVLTDGTDDPRVAAFRFMPGDALVVPENQERYGVMGHVLKPGYYPYPERQEDATLLKLLAAAGGSAANGDLRKASVTRNVEGKAVVTTVDVTALLQGTVPDMPLSADDVLYIPQANNWITVTGQINKPGLYNFDDTTTLVSLIGQAGGQLQGAALSKAFIRREGAQIPVDLQSVIVKGQDDPAISNFKLLPGDVLVIPEIASRFTVMGEVKQPGKYYFPDAGAPTVIDALSIAGGQAANGNLNRAGIVRMVDGQATVIPVELGRLSQKNGGVVANATLQPGDILYVPEKKSGSILGKLTPLAIIANAFGL